MSPFLAISLRTETSNGVSVSWLGREVWSSEVEVKAAAMFAVSEALMLGRNASLPDLDHSGSISFILTSNSDFVQYKFVYKQDMYKNQLTYT